MVSQVKVGVVALLSKLSYLIVRRGWVHLQEGMNGVMPWRIESGMLGKETFEKLAGNLTTSCSGKSIVQRRRMQRLLTSVVFSNFCTYFAP